MKERTRRILQALIQDFVETAHPVASKRLLESGSFDVSSATVRNEFALLEEVGLIKSPHVSAGKVPTEKGYRFYVDNFPEADEETLVQEIFQKHIADYRLSKTKESVFDALRLLSRLSANVAFAVVESDQTFYVGLPNVLRSPEFAGNPEQAAQIVEVLEGRERFRGLLSSLAVGEEVRVFIGEENLLEEIQSCSMIVGEFAAPTGKGVLGILGPMRMRYLYNKALIKSVRDMIV